MSEKLTIRNEETGSGGRYVAEIGSHVAEMTYSRVNAGLIIVDHTGVPDALRGQGIAQALAVHAVEDARKNGWKILPLCSFMRVQFTRHSDWNDVLQER